MVRALKKHQRACWSFHTEVLFGDHLNRHRNLHSSLGLSRTERHCSARVCLVVLLGLAAPLDVDTPMCVSICLDLSAASVWVRESLGMIESE